MSRYSRAGRRRQTRREKIQGYDEEEKRARAEKKKRLEFLEGKNR